MSDKFDSWFGDSGKVFHNPERRGGLFQPVMIYHDENSPFQWMDELSAPVVEDEGRNEEEREERAVQTVVDADAIQQSLDAIRVYTRKRPRKDVDGDRLTTPTRANVCPPHPVSTSGKIQNGA
ncbi:hypothetical protein V2J09_015045 [Rumex salicifolius]